VTIGRGAEWGEPATGPADIEVTGGDADLAAAVTARPGALIRLTGGPSQIARAVGSGREVRGRTLPMDALRLDGAALAVNALVLGIAPARQRGWHRSWPVRVDVDGQATEARATAVVVMTGEFLAGADANPRSHPGDGRAEVYVYAVSPRQRRALRARLASGTHLPHPEIRRAVGARIAIAAGRPVACEIDGVGAPPRLHVVAEVVPAAYRLLV
jgi:hypothetical protein